MRFAHNEHLFIEAILKGYFRIDNEGRIWITAINFSNQYVKNQFIKIPEREINTINVDGYIQVNLRVNGKKYTYRAHRIVWTYFNGKIPNGMEINHKNGIKTANWPENLELATHSKNKKHAFKTGLMCNKGENNPRAKLTENDVRIIRVRYKNGAYQKSIAKSFNISRSHVGNIINRKTWRHIS